MKKHPLLASFLLLMILIRCDLAHGDDKVKIPNIKTKIPATAVAEVQQLLLGDEHWFLSAPVLKDTREKLAAFVDGKFYLNSIRQYRSTIRWESRIAAGVGLMVRWTSLIYDGKTNTYDINHIASNHCEHPGSPERHETAWIAVPSVCNAVLVTRSRVVTAAHCLRQGDPCEDFGFVFGVSGHGEGPFINIPASRVRRCKMEEKRSEIVEVGGTRDGWLSLSIDPVDIEPMIAELTPVKSGTKVAVVGNPLGLATRVSTGKSFRRAASTNQFEASIDWQPGGSGAPVYRRWSLFHPKPRVIGLFLGAKESMSYQRPGDCTRVLTPCSPADDPDNCRGPILLDVSTFSSQFQ